ncbi:MAG: heavy metal translocating P-type ATPase, partial [Proteobacteria bacterium]
MTGPAPSPGESLELDVIGMTCGACVRRVEKALAKVEGVSEATVNLVTNRATIQHDGRTDAVALAGAIRAAGYEVPVVEPPPLPQSTSSEAEAGPARSALEQAEDSERSRARRDLVVAAVLTAPLLVVAMSHGALAGLDGPEGRWLQFALATPVVFGPGRRFFRLAWQAARHGASDMNTLVALGTGAAWGYSAVALGFPALFPHGTHGALPHLYFEAAAAVVAFVLLGKWIEVGARGHLSDAVRGLVALQPKWAHRIRSEDGREAEEDVPVERLKSGERIRIRPGERMPTDGRVIEGSTTVDESTLTGESMPVDKHVGDSISGGTLNQVGSVVVEVTQIGSESALGRVVAAVEAAQGSRAPIARLADRVSGIFVPVVLGLAVLTFLGWMVAGADVALALERMVSVLVIACPCALGLATPAAIAVGTGRAAQLGVLFKGGGALEAASRVDTVFLDKTGTLTAGHPIVTDVVPGAGVDDTELLRLVASVEAASEHPLGRALIADATQRGIPLSTVEGFQASLGRGVEGIVGGQRVKVGTAAWLGI